MKKPVPAWCARLRALMHAQDLSVRDLSRATGISAGGIGDYMSARRTPPLDKFIKLAAALHVHPAALVFPSDAEMDALLSVWPRLDAGQRGRILSQIYKFLT